MKQFAFAMLAAVCLAFASVSGSVAAPANGAAIGNAATALSLVEQVYVYRRNVYRGDVYRRSVYRGNAYRGCKRVRTCGPNGCAYVRRCW